MKKIIIGLVVLSSLSASSVFAYPIVRIVECQMLSNKVYLDDSYQSTQGFNDQRCSKIIASSLNDDYKLQSIEKSQSKSGEPLIVYTLIRD